MIAFYNYRAVAFSDDGILPNSFHLLGKLELMDLRAKT